jgi:hypothetical protein
MKTKGLILAAIHLALALSVAGKFYYDRTTLPHVWAKAAPFDPHLPIRGRYVRIQLEAEGNDMPSRGVVAVPVQLSVENGKLMARRHDGRGGQTAYPREGGYRLATPVAFFIPESIPDPSIRQAGEELWVDVSVPRNGPPRPIRLGVMKDGVLTPLAIR